jgi:hypothetical protein
MYCHFGATHNYELLQGKEGMKGTTKGEPRSVSGMGRASPEAEGS